MTTERGKRWLFNEEHLKSCPGLQGGPLTIDIHVDIHADGKRFIHVELTGKLSKDRVPNILRAIAEDLENGQEITFKVTHD